MCCRRHTPPVRQRGNCRRHGCSWPRLCASSVGDRQPNMLCASMSTTTKHAMLAVQGLTSTTNRRSMGIPTANVSAAGDFQHTAKHPLIIRIAIIYYKQLIKNESRAKQRPAAQRATYSPAAGPGHRNICERSCCSRLQTHCITPLSHHDIYITYQATNQARDRG